MSETGEEVLDPAIFAGPRIFLFSENIMLKGDQP
jgi:hypothetical protein